MKGRKSGESTLLTPKISTGRPYTDTPFINNIGTVHEERDRFDTPVDSTHTPFINNIGTVHEERDRFGGPCLVPFTVIKGREKSPLAHQGFDLGTASGTISDGRTGRVNGLSYNDGAMITTPPNLT